MKNKLIYIYCLFLFFACDSEKEDKWSKIIIKIDKKQQVSSSVMLNDSLIFIGSIERKMGTLKGRVYIGKYIPKSNDWEYTYLDNGGIISFSLIAGTVVAYGSSSLSYYNLEEDRWIGIEDEILKYHPQKLWRLKNNQLMFHIRNQEFLIKNGDSISIMNPIPVSREYYLKTYVVDNDSNLWCSLNIYNKTIKRNNKLVSISTKSFSIEHEIVIPDQLIPYDITKYKDEIYILLLNKEHNIAFIKRINKQEEKLEDIEAFEVAQWAYPFPSELFIYNDQFIVLNYGNGYHYFEYKGFEDSVWVKGNDLMESSYGNTKFYNGKLYDFYYDSNTKKYIFYSYDISK